MSTWTVTNRATGEVVYAYTADEPTEFPGMEYATFNHIAQIPAPALLPTKRVSTLQFRDLFTAQEKVAIEFASLDDPAAPTEQRLMAAGLRVFLADVDAATPEPDGTSIDLLDTRTIDGVNTLETYGLIAAGRAAEILG